MYIYFKDKILVPKAYSSLKGLCEDAGIKYSSASRGKRNFIKPGFLQMGSTEIEVVELDHIKIKGRGKTK
jgi:hypothetical protein